MVSSGPNYPDTGADAGGAGSGPWTNASNIGADDGSRAASAAISGGGNTSILRATDFDFAIPTVATITGVKVETQIRLSGGSGGWQLQTRLVKGGSATGDTESSPNSNSTSEVTIEEGGDGSMWGATLTPADVNATTFGAQILADATTGFSGTSFEVDFIRITVYYTLPAPTVSAISPDEGTRLGGTSVTITGTNFRSGATVAIGGVACTSVVVNDDTEIECVTGAKLMGTYDVVVTNDDAQAGTLSNGYTYLPVTWTQSLTGTMNNSRMSGALSRGGLAHDDVVKLVKAGVVVGDDKGSADAYPGALAWQSYGGADDLWGTTWTPAEVNAADFGAVLSTAISTGGAAVDAFRVTVYYSTPGQATKAAYLAAIKVGSTGETVEPQLYRLPQAGMPVANDPSINKATSGRTFWTPRYGAPSRLIPKTYRSYDFWLDMEPESNTPGFEAWASVDDQSFFQLLDESGDAATLLTSGPKRLYFPVDGRSHGHYVQFKFVIPALSGNEEPVSCQVREGEVRFWFRPDTTSRFQLPLRLRVQPDSMGRIARRGVQEQRRELEALVRRGVPVTYNDPNGDTGYLLVTRVRFLEEEHKEPGETTLLAVLSCVRLTYDATAPSLGGSA